MNNSQVKEDLNKLEKEILFLDTLNDKLTPTDFLNRFCTHIICRAGKGQFSMSGKAHYMEKDDIVIWVPGTNVADILLSTDFEASILLFSRKLLSEIRPDNKLSVEGYLYLLNHPVYHLAENEREICEMSYKMLKQRISDTDNIFHKKIITCLSNAYIYDIFNIYAKELNKKSLSDEGTGLFERFLILVQDHCFTKREVAFYSKELCITPKYLSAVCKKTSGKTASDWIDEYTIQNIRILLRNDKLSIKDIANQMEFNNQSFFGRYVKRLIGVSPSEYREGLSKKTS